MSYFVESPKFKKQIDAVRAKCNICGFESRECEGIPKVTGLKSKWLESQAYTQRLRKRLEKEKWIFIDDEFQTTYCPKCTDKYLESKEKEGIEPGNQVNVPPPGHHEMCKDCKYKSGGTVHFYELSQRLKRIADKREVTIAELSIQLDETKQALRFYKIGIVASIIISSIIWFLF